MNNDIFVTRETLPHRLTHDKKSLFMVTHALFLMSVVALCFVGPLVISYFVQASMF